MEIKELTTEQLKKLFCEAIGFNSLNKDEAFIMKFEQRYGEITCVWGNDRWVIKNDVAFIEVTETVKFRCGSSLFGISNALLFDFLVIYKLLKEYGVINE